MKLSPEIKARIAAGDRAGDARRFADAQRSYLDALGLSADDDKELKGRLLINLGRTALSAGRRSQAVTYYRSALVELEGLPGEAVLETAHTHFNLADILIEDDAKQALVEIAQALDLYRRYPYTAQPDHVDAMILDVILRAQAGTCPERLPFAVWDDAKVLEPTDLSAHLVFNLASMLLSMGREGIGPPAATVRNELVAWCRRADGLPLAKEMAALLALDDPRQ